MEVNPKFTEMAKSDDARIVSVYTDLENEYIVEKHGIIDNHPFEYRLAIKRADKSNIRSWRILQDIKNAVVGDDAVAVEIYPKESQVTDTANMYHLWVFKAGYGPNLSLVPPNKHV